MKILFYKLYVLALMALVLWAAQFIYKLIYWKFEYTQTEEHVKFKKSDSPMQKLAKMRFYLDNNVATRKQDLGDIVFDEHYEEGHFHHVGQEIADPTLNGCDHCHTVLPHFEDEEARAFRNMHSYFMACETCHYDRTMGLKNIEYRWVSVKNEKVIEEPLARIKNIIYKQKTLKKAAGNYGARISPWLKKDDGKLYSILGKSNLVEAKSLLNNFQDISSADLKKDIKRIHRNITRKPLLCDDCHARKDISFSYDDLGYSEEEVDRLTDSEVASVISKYNKFHFPNLFIRKDNRKRQNEADDDEE